MAVSKKTEVTQIIHCNSCNRKTEHLRVGEYAREEEIKGDEGEVWGNTCWGWNIWECRGCKTLVGERYSYRDLEIDEFTKHSDIGEYYPQRQQEHLGVKKYFATPDILKQVYAEVISCYNQSHFLLCSVGLRMLLEGILKDKEVTGRDLKMQIENADFIPATIRTNLHGFRFLGNDATHRLEAPSNKRDLALAIRVIEDVLNIVYDLDDKSTKVLKRFSKGRSV